MAPPPLGVFAASLGGFRRNSLGRRFSILLLGGHLAVSQLGGSCPTGIWWVEATKHPPVHRTPDNSEPGLSISSVKPEKPWPRLGYLEAQKKPVPAAKLLKAPAAWGDATGRRPTARGLPLTSSHLTSFGQSCSCFKTQCRRHLFQEAFPSLSSLLHCLL